MTPSFVPGAPCWFDVTSPDIEVSAQFYRDLFGWSPTDTGPAHANYTLLHQDSAPVAGITTAATPDGGTEPARWLPYFAVADVSGTIETAVADGAAVVTAATTVPDRLEFALLADPDGAPYGIARLIAHPGTERWSQPNNPCWVQYAAPGAPAGAMAHYSLVLGWHYTDAAWETSTEAPYQALSTEAGEREFGGAARAQPGEPAPAWELTIHVPDCDAAAARAVELGGALIRPPHDNPGPSRLAVIADPVGASLALMAFGRP